MIKGINRTIIEVTDTGNIYYERALLVLKPEYTDVNRSLLEKEAKKMLFSMSAPSAIKKTPRHSLLDYKTGLCLCCRSFFDIYFYEPIVK